MNNFWQKLEKPFFCLAPMADVTDVAFRDMIAKYSKDPDASPTERPFGRVFWTEFVAADGLVHPKGRENLIIDLKFNDSHRPIVAQIFSGKPENIREAARICAELGFDGIDINMGCPDRTIEKQKSGSAMIKDPALAKAVIRAAKEGAPDLPVSVKTRLGYNKVELETWVPALLEEDIAVLSMHLRTRKEMSKVPAKWDLMKRIVEIRDEMGKDTLVVGNGDAKDLEDAMQKAKDSGCDGVMLGRAVFGNPWLFSGRKDIDVKEKLNVMVEHTRLFEKLLGEHKSFHIMKKHYKAYVDGFDGAKELRMKLMEKNTASEVEDEVNAFLEKL